MLSNVMVSLIYNLSAVFGIKVDYISKNYRNQVRH